MRQTHLPRSLLAASIFTLSHFAAAPLAAATFPGGFLEQPSTAEARAPMTAAQIQSMLPSRGKFSFPAPYNTDGIRLTNASDCGGADCVNYVGYAYWNNINNHVGQDSMLIMIGMSKSAGGTGPSLLEYNKVTEQVINHGALFDDGDALSWASGEGWYFSASQPHSLYINNDSSLLRYDVIERSAETVFNVNDLMSGNNYIWQVHSSADDLVHSATVRDRNSYAMLGCMAYNEGNGQFQFFPSQGDFDECQVDKSGKWLLIKENVDGQNGEDNRIINLETGQERLLLDEDGAVGHSDMGFGYMIGADNWANDANSVKVWDFEADQLEGKQVYHNSDWGVFAPAHISHSNINPSAPIEQQFSCGSSVNARNSAEANEVICFGLDGADQALVVAPVMTDLNASGGGNDSYSKAPKGNLDVTGQYFIWTSNMGGSRLDAFLVKVPTHLLTGNGTGTGSGAETSDGTGTGTGEDTTDSSNTNTAATWTDIANAEIIGDTLSKTSGCDGCGDAGAVSEQEIIGDGYLEFTVEDTQALRFVGLSESTTPLDADQIDFALRLQGGYAEVREDGAYRSDTPINSGDVLRITVQDGAVSFSRNGVDYYSSSAAPANSLRAYASLLSMGAGVSQAVMVSASSNTAPAGDSEAPSANSSTEWSTIVNAEFDGQALTKTSGCDGCGDAGAVAEQEIIGDGYLEFTIEDTQALRFVGLSDSASTMDADQIDFALRLQGGYAEVRENGAYRSDTPINSGDVLRITVQDGTVSFSRNGVDYYSSSASPSNNLRAYANLLSMGSSIRHAVITNNP